jgi:hypothetical protein
VKEKKKKQKKKKRENWGFQLDRWYQGID